MGRNEIGMKEKKKKKGNTQETIDCILKTITKEKVVFSIGPKFSRKRVKFLWFSCFFMREWCDLGVILVLIISYILWTITVLRASRNMKLLVSLSFLLLTLSQCWSQQCRMANWWRSFDTRGWSNCDSSDEFITGFYRNDVNGKDDKIYLLEEANCCKAAAQNHNTKSTCIEADWWYQLDS